MAVLGTHNASCRLWSNKWMQAPTNYRAPSPRVTSHATQSEPFPDVHPHMDSSTLAPFSWLHKGPLLHCWQWRRRLSRLPWLPDLITQGAKLRPALPKLPPHMPQHPPHSGAHGTRRVSPLLRDHHWQGTAAWQGGLVAGRFTPCSHSAQHAASPGDVTSSTGW